VLTEVLKAAKKYKIAKNICNLYSSFVRLPITVAVRSKAAGTLGSWVRIPVEAWMSVCVYSVCVVLCVGSGLATG
jgi:hypothetical protein